MPHHRLGINGRAGALTLAIELSLRAPWTILFGPSGSGKSTILRAACGVLAPVDGGALAVRLERRCGPPGEPESRWETLAGAAGPSLPAHRRKLAYAPQAAALLPHLTVERNVQFAASIRPDLAAGRRLAEEAMEIFALGPLAGRLPHTLSGGEAQRVNLARACATPAASLLLLDEPFAGADRALRDAMLSRLVPWLADRKLPVLSVTHDVDEALLLGADVVHLLEGSVRSQGPAVEVLAEERARMLAHLR